MCGDPDYTPGLAATLTMQGPHHFDNMLDNAFASCKGELQGRGGRRLRRLRSVHLLGERDQEGRCQISECQGRRRRAGQFRSAHCAEKDPGRAARPSRHQHHDLLLGRHVARRRAGGHRRRQDAGQGYQHLLRRRHQGRRRQGQVRQMGSTMAYLPYQEAYYGAAALMMALDGKPINAYIDEALLPRSSIPPAPSSSARRTSTSTSRFTEAVDNSHAAASGHPAPEAEQS